MSGPTGPQLTHLRVHPEGQYEPVADRAAAAGGQWGVVWCDICCGCVDEAAGGGGGEAHSNEV